MQVDSPAQMTVGFQDKYERKLQGNILLWWMPTHNWICTERSPHILHSFVINLPTQGCTSKPTCPTYRRHQAATVLVQIIYQQVQGQPRNNSKSPEAPQNFLKALASHQNQPECKDQKDHHDQWPLSWELRWQQKYLTFPRVHGSQCQVGLCAPLGWVKTH